jgi:3-hydroxybutyryl-CoA dehydrogenase
MSISDIQEILVVGAGTMGHGIAQAFACGGYSVCLLDIDACALNGALVQIRSNLQVMAEADVLPSGDIDNILDRIRTSKDVELSAADVNVAIEAVPEDGEIKRRVFEHLDQVCPLNTVLLSNTSGLDIFKMVRVRHPERFCIAHWYAPPYILPLVEVVKGPQTSRETIDLVVALLTSVGKTPIVLDKFVPGYIVTRLQVALNRHVNFLLDNGVVTPQQLDEAVKASLAPRMMVLGLVQRVDFTGLDVSLAIQKEMIDQLSPAPSFAMLQSLVDQGHLGVKTGKGFFDYRDRTIEQVLRERDLALIEILKGKI